jgi:hypothetical protein
MKVTNFINPDKIIQFEFVRATVDSRFTYYPDVRFIKRFFGLIITGIKPSGFYINRTYFEYEKEIDEKYIAENFPNNFIKDNIVYKKPYIVICCHDDYIERVYLNSDDELEEKIEELRESRYKGFLEIGITKIKI